MPHGLRFRIAILAGLAFGASSCGAAYPSAAIPGGENATVLAYAKSKSSKKIVFRVTNPIPSPLPTPASGVLIAYGSFIDPGASWTIVDLSKRLITRVITVTDRSSNEITFHIRYQTTRPLTISETNKIVRRANSIWDAEPQPPSHRPFETDVSCDVYLFDGDFVLFDRQMICPYESLVDAIESAKTPEPHYPLKP